MRGLVRARLLTMRSVSMVVLVLAESSDMGESSALLTLRSVCGLVSDLKKDDALMITLRVEEARGERKLNVGINQCLLK